MEIFRKRPFVLKTAEMDKKLKDIPDQIQEKSIQNNNSAETLTQHVDEANNVIADAKNWLSFVAYQAKLYKNAQTAASAIRKTLSKKHLSNEDKITLQTALLTLGTKQIENEPTPTIQNPPLIPGIGYAEISETFAYPGKQWDPILTPTKKTPQTTYNGLIKEAKTLEQGCRKTKQELKNTFEHVYNLLTKFVKQMQKTYDVARDSLNRNKEISRYTNSIENLVKNAKQAFSWYYAQDPRE